MKIFEPNYQLFIISLLYFYVIIVEYKNDMNSFFLSMKEPEIVLATLFFYNLILYGIKVFENEWLG